MKQKIVILVVLLLSFWLRFWDITKVPNGLYYDEIDAGYQARSILQTGRDYRGSLSPFYINSYVDQRTPIPVYLTVLSTAIFSNPILQVRMGTVILGTVNVFLVFILLKQWTKNSWLSIVGAFVAATNPWWIQFARYNHEANSVAFLTLLPLITFNFGLRRKSLWILVISSFLAGLEMYTYRTMSLFSPILFLIVGFIYFRDFQKIGFKKIGLLIVVFLLVTVPFIYSTTFATKDTPRIGQISIFSDPAIPVDIQRQRELDSGDLTDFTIGKKASLSSYVFNNKPLSYFNYFLSNYFSAFSVDFLFVHGDKNHRQMIEGQGMLLYVDIVAIGFGLYYLFKNRKNKYAQLILWLFFLSPIPSALTQDGAAHGSRMFAYSIPLLLVISFGWYFLFVSLINFRFRWIYMTTVGLFWLMFLAIYLHNYHVRFAVDSGRWYGSPYMTAMPEIMKLEKNYDKVVMVPEPDPPNLYLLFWGNISPKDTQAFGSNYSEMKNDGSFLDKFKVADLPHGSSLELAKYIQPNVLYLVTQQELPEDLRDNKIVPAGINLVDVITYPDKQVAFYLISKK